MQVPKEITFGAGVPKTFDFSREWHSTGKRRETRASAASLMMLDTSSQFEVEMRRALPS
jgi:hypothetical protein